MKSGVNKKGVSPVIATVLLVAMVVVIAMIVFFWFKNISQEAITKFETNVEVICNDVDFDSTYSSGQGSLYVLNKGNVPIYSMKMRVYTEGGYSTKDIQDMTDSDWPEYGLNPGLAFSSTASSISSLFYGTEKVMIIPVLVGVNDEGKKKIHTCAEGVGKQIAIE